MTHDEVSHFLTDNAHRFAKAGKVDPRALSEACARAFGFDPGSAFAEGVVAAIGELAILVAAEYTRWVASLPVQLRTDPSIPCNTIAHGVRYVCGTCFGQGGDHARTAH